MIRILVADDSPTVRMLLTEILQSDPDLQVIGEATDGADAIEAARRLKPDLITMDIQMPRMDGFEATKRIMAEQPTPILIVSTLDVHSVSVSMNALRAGALVVLPKPRGVDAPGFEEDSRKLVATAKTMARIKLVRRRAPPVRIEAPAPPPPAPAPSAGPRDRGRCVAVAASAGGPAALQRLLADLPGDFPVPVFIVQHIAIGFAQGLAQWLNESCPLQVKLAQDGERPQAGTVYLAPDDRHLGLSAGLIALSAAPPVEGFRPSGTFLFREVARAYGAGAIAVVLSGMGRDGMEGAREVRQRGGRVVAQSEESAQVWGMPSAIVQAGLGDLVLSPAEIAANLQWMVGRANE